MQTPCPAPEPATVEEALRLALQALGAVVASWPPDIRLTVRAIEAVVRLISLHCQLSGKNEADAWKTSAMEVVDEIRQTLATRGETDHAS